jgi:hypothetical protein
MNKLKIPIYSFFRKRTPKYIISKKFKLFLANRKKDVLFKSAKSNNEFSHLISNGMVVAENIIDKNIIENWISKYNIYNENFVACKGNVFFPFYNKEFHDILFNSNFLDYLNMYYYLVYGKKPVMQQMPTLVITKPDINQLDISHGKSNFPAVWHTDYLTEFTIHIPIVDINSKTNHTKYLNGSHTNFFAPPIGAVKVNETNNTNCFARAGDALFIDVDGWHRGHLEKGSFRAMIQLKYTIGNDQLTYNPNNIKSKNALERTKIKTKKFNLLKKVFQKDYKFFKKVNPDFNSPHAKLFLDYALFNYSK